MREAWCESVKPGTSLSLSPWKRGEWGQGTINLSWNTAQYTCQKFLFPVWKLDNGCENQSTTFFTFLSINYKSYLNRGYERNRKRSQYSKIPDVQHLARSLPSGEAADSSHDCKKTKTLLAVGTSDLKLKESGISLIQTKNYDNNDLNTFNNPSTLQGNCFRKISCSFLFFFFSLITQNK